MSDKDIPQVGTSVDDKQTSDIVTEKAANDDKHSRATCLFNGAQYSQGAIVCSSHKILECQWNGTWYQTTRSC